MTWAQPELSLSWNNLTTEYWKWLYKTHQKVGLDQDNLSTLWSWHDYPLEKEKALPPTCTLNTMGDIPFQEGERMPLQKPMKGAVGTTSQVPFKSVFCCSTVKSLYSVIQN